MDVCPECSEPFTPKQDRSGPKRQKYCSTLCRNHGASRASRAARLGYTRPDLVPQEVPDKSEIAWAAGFYEGEGWAGVVARSCRVTIGQKEDWCLERLRRYWGGTIDHPKNHVGMWRVSGTLAQNLLRAIYDDLSPRRQAQADRALASTSPVLDA